MPLLKGSAFAVDSWRFPAADEPLPASGDIALPFDRLLASLESLDRRQGRLGTIFTNKDRVAALLPLLARLDLIVLPFPSFTDGRAYSLARQLREMDYRGELRAAGNVLPDQLQFMRQVGFDSFETSERFAPELWLKASRQMSLAYQRGLFRPVGETEVWSARHAGPLAGVERPRVGVTRVYNLLNDKYVGLEDTALLEPLIREDYRGGIALVSSFGAESAVLLHMVATIDKTVPVIFVDTGKLFWQTRAYRSQLIDRLGFTDVRVVRPDAGDLAREDANGRLHAKNADLCCHIRKTLPLERALQGFEAWISGRKRFHGGGRENIRLVDMSNGRLKVEPLARWTASDLETYAMINELPPHPLAERGYLSIGCMPCTTKAGTADNPRAGRWAGTAKTECGIHWTANGLPIRAN